MTFLESEIIEMDLKISRGLYTELNPENVLSSNYKNGVIKGILRFSTYKIVSRAPSY